VTATKASDSTYTSTTSPAITVTVNAVTESALVAVASPSTIAAITGTSTLSTTGGSGTGAVTYAVTSGACTISGSTLTAGATSGTCGVTATKASDSTYTSTTSPAITVTVNAVTGQQSSLAVIASTSVIAQFSGSTLLSTTGGSGTGSVTYRVMSGTCSISGNILNAGQLVENCSVRAEKSGDSTYSATISTTISIFIKDRNILVDAAESSVSGMLAAQVSAAQRFANSQIQNISSHLDALKTCKLNIKCDTQNIKLNSAGLNDLSPVIQKLKQEYFPVANAAMGGASEPQDSFENSSAMKSASADIPASNNASPDGSSFLLPQNHANLSQGYLPDIAQDSFPSQNELANDGADQPNYAFWASGDLSFGSMTIQGPSTTKNQFSTSGVTVGVDYQVAKSIIIGSALGYGFDNTSIDSNGSRVKSSLLSFSGYGVYEPLKQWYLDGLIGGGKLQFNGNRFSTTESSLYSTSRSGNSNYGSIGLANLIMLNDLSIMPFVRLSYVDINLGRYDELGAVNALGYDAETVKYQTITTGVTSKYDIPIGAGKLVPSAKFLLASNQGGNITQNIYFADVGASGGNYYLTINTLPQFTESFGLGVSYYTKQGISIGLGWLGTVGSNSYSANSIKLDVRLPF